MSVKLVDPCANVDPETFFPFPTDVAGQEAAKVICRTCPLRVRIRCLQGALDRGEEFGIWGGATELERRWIRRRGLTAVQVLADADEPGTPE